MKVPHAITIEGLSASNRPLRVSGIFDVSVNASWREQPTHETLEAEIYAAILAVLTKRASRTETT